MEERKYDVVVLGGGPGGYGGAIHAAIKGLRVCLVEKDRMGGTCLNWGCFPTKCLLRDAQLFSEVRESRWVEGELKINFQKVIERKDNVINSLVQGIETVLLNRGVTILEGDGKFLGSRDVIVEKKDGSEVKLNAERFIIATGARLDFSPFRPDGEKILTSRDALTLTKLPKSIAVIGCGRRGVEFGSFFRSLGCNVVLVEKTERIVPQEDIEISHRLRRILTNMGIKVIVNGEAVGAEISSEGGVVLTLLTPKGENKIEVEKALIPGKRVGNTQNLGLELLGITTKDHFIEVNTKSETSVSGIYATGDVNGLGFFAHKALTEGISVVDHFTDNSLKINTLLIPRCTYTSPEIGSIGLTQMEAERREEEFAIGKFPMGASGRAATLNQTQGVMKIISGKKFGEILGVHILAPQATELISLASLAMRNEMGIEELKATMYGHPTLSEAFFESALDIGGEAIHFLKGNVEG